MAKTKPHHMFKITREIKIALTTIAAGILLFVGINFLKGINIFESSNSYYVKFKDIKGLAVSNAVYANGYPVGIVRDINYNYSDNNGVVVRIELDKNMKVPQGTTAELEVALMGGVTMNLLLGANPTAVVAPFDTISGGLHQGAMEQAGAMLPQVQQMLPKVDSLLTNLNRLTAAAELQQTIVNAAQINHYRVFVVHLTHRFGIFYHFNLTGCFFNKSVNRGNKHSNPTGDHQGMIFGKLDCHRHKFFHFLLKIKRL